MKTVILTVAKIIFLGIILAGGLVISRVAAYSLGFTIPRFPQQAGENEAVYYLLAGSMMLSAGFYFIIAGISGRFITRFLIAFLFVFLAFAVGVGIESSIYSDVAGYNRIIVVMLLPALLFSIAAAVITPETKTGVSFGKKIRDYFGLYSTKQWAWRFAVAILSFPFIYFFFGIMVSPFVSAYYSELVQGLNLPSPGTIVIVQLFRSLVFLVITLPVLATWRMSRAILIIALGLVHFVMVFAYDFYLALVMPVELILIHGVEILLDSYVYAWVLVMLIYPTQDSVKA